MLRLSETADKNIVLPKSCCPFMAKRAPVVEGLPETETCADAKYTPSTDAVYRPLLGSNPEPRENSPARPSLPVTSQFDTSVQAVLVTGCGDARSAPKPSIVSTSTHEKPL
jgi:hypothetical protein